VSAYYRVRLIRPCILRGLRLPAAILAAAHFRHLPVYSGVKSDELYREVVGVTCHDMQFDGKAVAGTIALWVVPPGRALSLGFSFRHDGTPGDRFDATITEIAVDHVAIRERGAGQIIERLHAVEARPLRGYSGVLRGAFAPEIDASAPAGVAGALSTGAAAHVAAGFE
jgi:hypothetical protein